jgi:hypothetical protein
MEDSLESGQKSVVSGLGAAGMPFRHLGGLGIRLFRRRESLPSFLSAIR